MKHLSNEPRLDPPDSPELFFKCDECGKTLSDSDCNIKDGDVCEVCDDEGQRGYFNLVEYEPTERDWERYDDN